MLRRGTVPGADRPEGATVGHDIAHANARAQLAALRAGTTTAGALIDATTQQIADIAPLRAIAAFDPGRAQHLAARADATPANGPLHGLPVVVKDSIDTADLPTTAGTGALQGRTPTHDAPVVARLRAAGAIVAAKSTLHELSFGITGNNAVTGAVANPYDPNLIAGGSSSGSAVAVATGVASVALAADTGGSARLPAALCGVVGFRPTHGRYPGAGVVPISHTRDSVGVMARDVDSVALVDAVLAGENRHRSPPSRSPARDSGSRPSAGTTSTPECTRSATPRASASATLARP